jgi:phosphatidylinositol alpha-mannosyltransferase
VAHALSPVNGWAAARARTLGGPSFVLSLMGLPTRRSVGIRRLRRRLTLGAIRGASATTTLSEAAAKALRESLGCPATALLGAVYGQDFRSDRPRADVPTLLCTASLDDPRKRGALLLRAFTRLREERPELRLLVAGGGDPQQGRPPVELPAGATRLEATSGARFTQAYATAWASVLASVDEALGLVLAESLAAGTPVVAARSGGCPEIVSDERVGRLFAPDDEDDLVRALREALELAGRSETSARCRARADELDWSRWLPRYEALYEVAAGRR